MKVLVYSTQPYDRQFLQDANHRQHELYFNEASPIQKNQV
jgi:hypothetical protein